MFELVESRFTMLNPIVTKFLAIQSSFYSKSFANFSPIGSIDPNKSITEKAISNQQFATNQRPAGAIHQK